MPPIDLRLIILVIAVLVNGFLATAVYKNNSRNATNRVFAALSVITILWLIDAYVSVAPKFIQNSLLWGRLSVSFAVPQIMCFYLLAKTLPHAVLQVSKKTLYRLFALTLVVMGVGLSPLAFSGVVITGNQVKAEPGVGLPIFVIFAISFSFAAVYTLVKKFYKSQGNLRDQYRLVVVGLVVMLGLLIATVLIPIALVGNSRFVPLTPLYTIFFLGLTTIAIIRHRLFDLRAAIARVIAYSLLISTLSGLYVLAVFGLSNRLVGTESVFAQQVVPILAAIFLVFTAPFFKRLFDRITNKFFYQDAYDPQVLMDELNGVLISNIELSILLRQASEVIQRHIKIEFCVVAVHESNDSPLRIVGTKDMHLNTASSALLRGEMNRIITKTIIADELGSHHAKLKKILHDGNIAIAINLHSGSRHVDDLAYMLLGPKRSGNIYSRKDVKVIEIIADSMVIAIQNALRFEEIQGFAAILQERVDEATAKLKRTNAKLRELDETKDEFISMASHQLRTPLTSVKGYLSMVLEGDVGKVDAKQKKLLNQAFVSSQRMVYLIADLLNVSRLKTGKFVIMPTPTNLADVVAGEIGQLSETAKAKKIKLIYKKPDSLPSLNIDETKIRQVIMNFADNAIYYTPNGGEVKIEISQDKSNVYVVFKDNGLGVPKAEQKLLFTKFFRASNAKQVRPDGTGLGLFMAKKVVAAQGGSIIFESTEGKGSTFGFCFSKAKLDVNQTN